MPLTAKRPHLFSPLTANPSPFACLLLLLLAGGLAGCGQAARPRAPEAINGLLDCAGWDFKKDGPLELKGDWKCAWRESDPRFSAPEFDDTAWDNYSIPGTWNKSKGTPHGYAWYRLRITNLPRTEEALGLYLQRSQTASVLYANGAKILSDGVPGESMAATVPGQLPQVVPVPGADELVLSWHIANFHNRQGGPLFSPVLGLFKDLAHTLWLGDLGEALVIGFMLMMGVYNLILWFMRRRERASLYFALFCLTAALRVLLLFNSVQRIFPGLDVFELRMRLEYFATPASVFCFAAFLRSLFPAEIPAPVIRIAGGTTAVICASGLLVPTWITTNFVTALMVVLVLFVGFIIFAGFRALLKRREGAVVILTGLVLLLAAVVHDMLVYNAPRFNEPYLAGWGALGVIICYTAILSLRFTRALTTAELLSADLRGEVERQTARISEQKRELERLVREKTDLFINYNHETRTPLMLIENYLDKLAAEHGDSGSLKMIRRNVDKMKRDVENSLTLEKLGRRQALYDHHQAAAVSECVAEKILLFREVATHKGVALEYQALPGVCGRIDPAALDEILNNLLDNAIRYTAPGGKIEVTLRAAGRRLELEVKDSGQGMPAEQLANIFEPYHQICRAKGARQGMGIGLSIVKRIMDAVRGSIGVSSDEGKGSVFTLSFPACPPPPPGMKPAAPERAVPPSPVDPPVIEETYVEGKDNVLLVEDNRGMLAYLQENLRDDFNVFCAASAREAIARLEAIPLPHLIVSDIMMDGMDGFEFIEALGASDKYRSVPLVFLTARASGEDRLSGLSRGAVDVMAKPIRLPELKTKIRSLIANQKAQREALVREMKEKIGDFLKPADAAGSSPVRQEENFRRFKITRREREIILLLFQGLAYKEVSDLLSISLNTLKPYVRSIYGKCHVQNRMELLNAIRNA